MDVPFLGKRGGELLTNQYKVLPPQEVTGAMFWDIAQHNSRHMSHEENVYLRGMWPRMNNSEDH